MFKIGIYSPGLLYSVGGAHAYAVRLALILSELYPHCSMDFITNCFEDSFDEEKQKKRFEEKYAAVFTKHIGIISVHEKKEPGFRDRLKAIAQYKKISEDYDLFINTFHNLHYFRGKKNIHIIHFPCEKRTRASPTLKKIPFLYPAMLYADIKYAASYNLYACNSQFTLSWLNRYWKISKKKQCILYPPILPIQNEQIPYEKKRILILSRIDPDKKIDVLVDAFIQHEKQLSDFSLVIAGHCPEYARECVSYAEDLKEKIKNHRIKLYLNLSQRDLQGIIKDCAVFWHGMGFGIDEDMNPLKTEHFGMTTAEVMSAGLVPCVINKGGQKEIVDDGVNGLRWNTIEELIQKTLVLINDKNLLKKMSEEAVKKADLYTLRTFKNSVRSVMETYKFIPKEESSVD